MTFATVFKKTSRAALVALTLGAATVTALPAQAQSSPSFNFELGIGSNGSGMSFRGGNKKPRLDRCLTNRQVERGLRHYGFDDVNVVRSLGKNRVLVIAEWGIRDYSMKVDKCSGRVYDVERLRHRRGMPGFNFQFNF